MIHGCSERMSWKGCSGCDRADGCTELWPALGMLFGGRVPEQNAAKHSFLAFLRGVAGAVEASRRPRQTPFTQQVERTLEPLLASGTVRIDEVARELGLSRQTLYRRLKAEGTTFERLRDRLRRRVALRLIRNEGVAVKEAAWRLGFSDPASFSRAFKRWTGKSPRDQRGPRQSG